MSRRSRTLQEPGLWEEPAQLVVVLDTSPVIDVKGLARLDEHWSLFSAMRQLVDDGRLTFPRQVSSELTRMEHPDFPGGWAADAVRLRRHPEPDDQSMVEVLAVAHEIVEVNAEHDREPADPYVVALAHELRLGGYEVAVASNDYKDRLPAKLSIKTACDRLGITFWTSAVFIDWVRGCRDGADVAAQTED